MNVQWMYMFRWTSGNLSELQDVTEADGTRCRSRQLLWEKDPIDWSTK